MKIPLTEECVGYLHVFAINHYKRIYTFIPWFQAENEPHFKQGKKLTYQEFKSFYDTLGNMRYYRKRIMRTKKGDTG